MAARAMWKGVVRFGDVRVPVKLYAAVRDASVRFRLLHRDTHGPVVQRLVDPETDEVVPYEAIDHRWCARPYYLGPDGDGASNAALARALERRAREGAAQWTMRRKRRARDLDRALQDSLRASGQRA